MKLVTFITLLPTLLISQVFAGSLQLDFTFAKRAPFAALAYIQDGGEQKAITIDQKNKQFMSKAYVSAPTSQISFKNSDTMDHNIYANSPEHGVKFDIGLLAPDAEKSIDNKNWPNDAVVRIGCKIHPKMKSYIVNVATSNSKVVEFQKKIKSYQTTLDNVVPMASPLAIWLPKYDPITLEIKPGSTQKIDLVKKGKVKGFVTVAYVE